MGGTCTTGIDCNFGPWEDYELIDDRENGLCGVKRKSDPNAKLITPNYVCSLENPVISK